MSLYWSLLIWVSFWLENSDWKKNLVNFSSLFISNSSIYVASGYCLSKFIFDLVSLEAEKGGIHWREIFPNVLILLSSCLKPSSHWTLNPFFLILFQKNSLTKNYFNTLFIHLLMYLFLLLLSLLLVFWILYFIFKVLSVYFLRVYFLFSLFL